MTRNEAYQYIKTSLRYIRDKNLVDAIQMALHALAWECAHEKMISSITVEESKDIKKQVNEN